MKTSTNNKWSAERANEWWAERDWVCGFNFLPSTAVNFLEMWMGSTFDHETIGRELKWASDLGFNSVRTNIQFLDWKNDRDGLIKRLDWFLASANQLGISTMPALFDDCGFGGLEPTYGIQPDPVANIHNSRAVASPGRATVMDRSQWSDLKRYVTDVITQFQDDPRILLWDLYNEPGNLSIFAADSSTTEYDQKLLTHSRDLMVECFGWAREIDPSQPLTVGAWRTRTESQDKVYNNDIDRLALEYSDVITFHAYCDLAHAQQYVGELTKMGRPVISTEWMARSIGSKIDDQLEFYHRNKIGCYNWGMVKGRSQTHLPWPHLPEESNQPWFHDVLWPDGTAYNQDEVQLVSKLARMNGREPKGVSECPA